MAIIDKKESNLHTYASIGEWKPSVSCVRTSDDSSWEILSEDVNIELDIWYDNTFENLQYKDADDEMLKDKKETNKFHRRMGFHTGEECPNTMTCITTIFSWAYCDSFSFLTIHADNTINDYNTTVQPHVGVDFV